jgi:hypothetical protein
VQQDAKRQAGSAGNAYEHKLRDRVTGFADLKAVKPVAYMYISKHRHISNAHNYRHVRGTAKEHR